MDSTKDLLPIRSEFVKSADQRLARIGLLLCEIRQDREDASVLEELHSMFHNLAGTGGACGYPRLASRSRYAETLCEQLRRRGHGPKEEELRTFLDTLAALKCLLKIEEPAGEESSAMLKRPKARTQRVAVLEWIDPARRACVEAMALGGLMATGVSSGEELFALMQREPIDGIVADADLLARDQFKLLRELRARPGRRPVIVLFGTLSVFADKMMALCYGADAYVEHSAGPAQLTQRLKELLKVSDPVNANVMVVEDDPVQTALLRAILQPSGYQVTSCKDPRYFEHELNVSRPDVLILDLMLPGGFFGSDLARYVRQHPVYQDVPIIFLSGCNHKQMHAAAAQSASMHLQKPVTPEILLRAVSGCLRGMRRLAAVRTSSVRALNEHTL
jgi:DNA-binding response OmpR family regulator